MNTARPQAGSRCLAALLALLLAMALAACGGAGGGAPAAPEEPPAAVARVEITPAGVLLTGGAGSTRALGAHVYDAQGRLLDRPVTWASSRPDQLAVAADGLLRTVVDAGAAQITASAGGVSSAPMLAVAARPAPGVVVIDDAQVVGEPADSNPDAAPDLDNTYRVTLTGVPAPAPGTLLLGSGAKPLAGRVLTSTAVGAQTELTMRLAPLAELFAELHIDERVALASAGVTIDPAVQAQFEVVREGDTWRFTPRPGATGSASSPSGARKQRLNSGEQTVSIAPFGTCKITTPGFNPGSASPVRVEASSFSLGISPTLDLRHTPANGLERLVVEARPVLRFNARLKTTASINGKVACKRELFAINLPIGGALSLLLGGRVPVGVGFEWSAATEVASVTVGVQAEARATARAGIECQAATGCGFASELDVEDPTLTSDPPDGGDLRLVSKLKVFGYLEGEFGSPLLRSLRFKAFEARAGGTLDGQFAPPLVQQQDSSFAARYRALRFGSAQVTPDVDRLVQLLSLGALRKVGIEIDDPVALSPQLNLARADRASFAAGDTVNVSVLLDPSTLNFGAGFYNVESIELRRVVAGATEVVARQMAGANQSRFEFAVVAPHAGDATDWQVFVTTRWLPFEALSLELGRAAPESAEVLLTRASAGGLAHCAAEAREAGGDPLRAQRHQEVRSPEGEANPATCAAEAWDARAIASGIGEGTGPAQDAAAPPVAVTQLSGTGSASATATATPNVSLLPVGTRYARGYGYGAGGGQWWLRVQGQAVTMTLSGSLSGPFASVRANWAPSPGGAGTAGVFFTSPSASVLNHSVRLEPGQTVVIGYVVQAQANEPAFTDGLTRPGPVGTVALTVSFAPVTAP